MLALVSPAKKLDFDTSWDCNEISQSDFLDDTQELVNTAKALPKDRLQSLMKLSDKLGDLNYARYQNFSLPFAPDNAKPAVYTFRGDTYVGLDADTLSDADIDFAQGHFRMLSGLYGMLRPLDLMQPYRLEMGTRFSNPRGENLYDFWGDILTHACNDITHSHKDRSVIALASNEYIKAVRPKGLKGGFITCHFKDVKNGEAKVVGLFAKRARGAMARYMIQNKLETPEGLKAFDADGYVFQDKLSDDENYVFIRDQES